MAVVVRYIAVVRRYTFYSDLEREAKGRKSHVLGKQTLRSSRGVPPIGQNAQGSDSQVYNIYIYLVYKHIYTWYIYITIFFSDLYGVLLVARVARPRSRVTCIIRLPPGNTSYK